MFLIARATLSRSAVAVMLGTALLAGLVAPAPADQLKIAPCLLNGKCKLSPSKVPPFHSMPGLHKAPGSGYGTDWGYGPDWGYGAAALAGGLALGSIAAASAARAEPVVDEGCYTAKRKAVDEDGNVFFRRVQVCD